MASIQKPLIIPVFIPHAGCPHRCVFCNQSIIAGTPATTLDPSNVRLQISSFLDGCRKGSRPSQIAYYGGNFLGLSPDRILTLLWEAARFVAEKRARGIRFSTRPDTIDPRRLGLLTGFPVEMVEIGAQSMDDRVLEASRRGHTAADTVRAANLVRKGGYQLGLQIMVGLPEDNENTSMETAHRAAALAPDVVRIYPTVVVEGSLLARWYREGTYSPWTLDRAVSLTAWMADFFQQKSIRVIRMGLQATEDLQPGGTILDGPYHPAFGHLVYARMFLEKATKLLVSRKGENGGKGLSDVVLRVHPKAESRLRGMKNENIQKLKDRFGIETFTIQKDITLAENDVEVL